MPPLTGKLGEVQILTGIQVPPGGASVGSQAPCGLTAVTDTLHKARALVCRRHSGPAFYQTLPLSEITSANSSWLLSQAVFLIPAFPASYPRLGITATLTLLRSPKLSMTP